MPLQGVDLGQHVAEGTRTLRAPERGDGTKPAVPVATLRDLDISPGCPAGGRGRLEGRSSGRRPALAPAGARMTGTPKPGDPVDFGQSAASSSPYRSAMQPVTTSLAPSFLEAASSSTVPIDSSRAACMKAQVLTTTRSACSAWAAGLVALRIQQAGQLVRVHLVLRAPQGFHPISASHPAKSTGRPVPAVPAQPRSRTCTPVGRAEREHVAGHRQSPMRPGRLGDGGSIGGVADPEQARPAPTSTR